MQRYFSERKEDDYFLLNHEDTYHIEKVMRMKLDEMIEIVYQKEVYLCNLVSINPTKGRIIKKLLEYHENKEEIILVQSLVNENKMDMVLQKGTELGVTSFYGYKAVNSVIKENGKGDKKILRWQKIVKEASEQSKRNIIPKVIGIINLKELCSIQADLKILLSVKEQSNSLKNVLQNNKMCATIIIVVGPEGGFTDLEENELIKNGFIRTSLGGRVLRTETASMVTLSMINYEWMV